jgi:hypothetical protein
MVKKCAALAGTKGTFSAIAVPKCLTWMMELIHPSLARIFVKAAMMKHMEDVRIATACMRAAICGTTTAMIAGISPASRIVPISM